MLLWLTLTKTVWWESCLTNTLNMLLEHAIKTMQKEVKRYENLLHSEIHFKIINVKMQYSRWSSTVSLPWEPLSQCSPTDTLITILTEATPCAVSWCFMASIFLVPVTHLLNSDSILAVISSLENSPKCATFKHTQWHVLDTLHWYNEPSTTIWLCA